METTKYHIKSISALCTHPARQIVLRPGKPISDCIFSDDDTDSTIHLGLFYGGNIVGVASLMQKNASFSPKTKSYQLRGMAVLPEHQGKGYGQALLNHAETILIAQGIELLWCNARKSATSFYKKNNFQVQGDAFEIPEIGKHYMMFKSIFKLVRH